MAMKQTLSKTPTALASTTTGTDYTVQCRASSHMYVQVADTSSAPTTHEAAFVVGSMNFATVKHESGEGIFVWQDDMPAFGNVVYDESA